MSNAVPHTAPGRARHRARRSPGRTLAAVLTTGVCTGVFFVLLQTAVAEPSPRHPDVRVPTAGTTGTPGMTGVAVPYGGQLDRPDPEDEVEPGSVMGLGLLALGLVNGLVFAASAALDGVRGPSAAETRRRLRQRTAPGSVPGRRRDARHGVPWRVPARVVAPPAAAHVAHAAPGVPAVPARRSHPHVPVPGTTWAPVPPPRLPEPGLAPVPTRRPARPSPVPRAVPADPVPSQGAGQGSATGPWGWRPARPDPVPWRNPSPALAGPVTP